MKRYAAGLLVLFVTASAAFLLQPGNAIANNTTAVQASAIVRETISVTLFFSSGVSIDFGNLAADTDNNSATNNLNISIDPATNVATNISQNATGFTGPDTLALSNLKYGNASGAPGLANATVMTTSFPAPPFGDWKNISKPAGSNVYRDVFYWLTIPASQAAGTYTTNIYINVTAYQ